MKTSFAATVAITLSIAALSSCAGTPEPSGTYSAPAPIGKPSQAEVWLGAWSFVNDEYYDPGFRGVDWPAMKDEAARRIGDGLDEEAFLALMRGAFESFSDVHTCFLSPAEYRNRFDPEPEPSGFTGIGMLLARGEGDSSVIFHVIPGGPGDATGLRSHDSILSIGGRSTLDPRGFPDIPRFRGPEGSIASLLVAFPGRKERTVEVTRGRIAASVPGAFGRVLPAGLSGGCRIGYINYHDMGSIESAGDLRAEFARLSAEAPLDGLVLDLRVNDGGVPENLWSAAGLFMEGCLGCFRLRNGETFRHYAVGGGVGNSLSLPLAILIHGTTLSAAELLAGSLDAAGRAILVGERTAGETAALQAHRLPGGYGICVTTRNFLLPDGSDPGWLDRGIEPDIEAPDSGWGEFSDDGDDPALRAALAALEERIP